MVRPRRIEYQDAFYHVFSRGNNRQDIFVTDDDWYLFLDTLDRMSERLDIDFLAYKWLNKDLILPQIHGADKHQNYCNVIWKG